MKEFFRVSDPHTGEDLLVGPGHIDPARYESTPSVWARFPQRGQDDNGLGDRLALVIRLLNAKHEDLMENYRKR